MTIKVTFPNGEIQIIPKAVRVNEQNYHEGMYDFYSEGGGLIKQIKDVLLRKTSKSYCSLPNF